MNWQRIETGPHDGTRVLLWLEGRDVSRCAVGKWIEGPDYSGWVYRVSQALRVRPTHWAPLPEGPT